MRVDLAAELVGCVRQPPGQTAKGHGSDDHEVHVAFGFFEAARDRAEDEGARHVVAGEAAAEKVEDAARLGDEGAQVGKDRMRRVGAVVGPIAAAPQVEQPERLKAGQFLPDGGTVEGGPAGDFARVELASGRVEEEAQDLGFDAGGQELRQEVHMSAYTIQLSGLSTQTPRTDSRPVSARPVSLCLPPPAPVLPRQRLRPLAEHPEVPKPRL